MSQIRYTDESIRIRQEKIGTLREKLHDLDVYLAGRESPFWQKLRLDIENSVKVNRAHYESILDLGYISKEYPMNLDEQNATVRTLRGAARFGERILEQVDRAEKLIERDNQKIENLKKEIQDIQRQMGAETTAS